MYGGRLARLKRSSVTLYCSTPTLTDSSCFNWDLASASSNNIVSRVLPLARVILWRNYVTSQPGLGVGCGSSSTINIQAATTFCGDL